MGNISVGKYEIIHIKPAEFKATLRPQMETAINRVTNQILFGLIYGLMSKNMVHKMRENMSEY